jgi:hypothetical protein
VLSFTAGFTDVRAFTQLPGFPNDYGLRFASRSSVPRRPGLHGEANSFRQLHLLRSFLPLVRPCQQLRVAPRQLVVSLLGFFPFEALFLPRLGFSTRLDLEDPGSLPCPRTRVCDLEDRWPPRPGETFLSTSTQEDLVDGLQTVMDWTAPPLDGVPSLLALVAGQARRPDLQSF